MEKQYFDRLVLDDEGNLCVADDQDITLTQVEISCIGRTEQDPYKFEVVLQQQKHAWWYSRKKFSAKEAEAYVDEITKMINESERRKWA